VHDLPMPAPPESGPPNALPPGTDAPGSPLPVEAAIGVAVSVGKSLRPMHEEGLVHGHVHPGRILHGPEGPMLAAAPGPGAPPLADPGFAAPEVLRGEAATVAADVYGLGATLWSLLAGHPPFTADDPQDPASGRPVPHVPRDDVPEWLANVLTRALAGEPAERYPTAHAFTDALEQGLRDGSAPPTAWENLTGWSWEDTAPEPGDTLDPEEAAFLAAPVTPPPRRRSRRPVLAAVAVLVLAVTAIGVTTLTAGSGTNEQRTRAESSPTNRTPPNPSPTRTPAAQVPPPKPTQTPTSAPTSLRPVKDYVPGQVRIVDGRISIEVTWLDRSGGRATHYVVGGPSGHPPTTLGSAAPGTAKVTVTALNPSVDYCLTVVAVVDVDRVSQAKPVCTHRVQRRG
jgi:hypothetical protein